MSIPREDTGDDDDDDDDDDEDDDDDDDEDDTISVSPDPLSLISVGRFRVVTDMGAFFSLGIETDTVPDTSTSKNYRFEFRTKCRWFCMHGHLHFVRNLIPESNPHSSQFKPYCALLQFKPYTHADRLNSTHPALHTQLYVSRHVTVQLFPSRGILLMRRDAPTAAAFKGLLKTIIFRRFDVADF